MENRVSKGAYNEIVATAWLLKNGYSVFRNISPNGPVDLVAIKNSEVTLIDVKAANAYKGKLLPAYLSRDQEALGIKVLIVYPDGNCKFGNMRPVLVERTCAHCTVLFTPKRSGQFCTKLCKTRYYNAKTALKRPINGC